jgi:hypothetical protein
MGDLQNDDIKASITAFDQLIGDTTTNKADIASHYNHSPERHRLYINGSRFNLQYGNTTPKFTDSPDSYDLKPAANDVIEYQTAERFRYAVGYILSISQAFRASQSLETGDKIVVGYGEADLANDMANADGWFVEFVPELDDDDAYITEYRDGTQLDSQRVSGLNRFNNPLTDWRRIENTLNWYNVGNREVIETFTDGGIQKNQKVQDSSIDGNKGPLTGNHRVTFGVKAGSNTDNLVLECGSVGVIIKGNADRIVRDKAGAFTGTYQELTADNWEPVAAMRINPDEDLVNVQLTGFQVMESVDNTDVQLLAISVDSSNTDASNFRTPIEHNEDNSVLEITDATTDVTTFPDSNGNIVTNATNPGGYQLGYASQYTEGTGTNERSSGESRVRKRNIYNGDVAIVLAKAGTATDITFEYNTEQDW